MPNLAEQPHSPPTFARLCPILHLWLGTPWGEDGGLAGIFFFQPAQILPPSCWNPFPGAFELFVGVWVAQQKRPCKVLPRGVKLPYIPPTLLPHSLHPTPKPATPAPQITRQHLQSYSPGGSYLLGDLIGRCIWGKEVLFGRNSLSPWA